MRGSRGPPLIRGMGARRSGAAGRRTRALRSLKQRRPPAAPALLASRKIRFGPRAPRPRFVPSPSAAAGIGVSGGRVRLVRTNVRNPGGGADQWTTSPRACPETGRGRGPVDDPSARMSGIRARARTSDRLVCMAGKNQPTIRICSRPVPVWSAWLIRTVPDSDARFWCTVALRDTDAQRGPSLLHE